jgi:ERCC4-related helicase
MFQPTTVHVNIPLLFTVINVRIRVTEFVVLVRDEIHVPVSPSAYVHMHLQTFREVEEYYLLGCNTV